MRPLLIVAVCSSLAHAQPSLVEPDPPPAPAKRAAPAMWWSIGVTAAGIAAVAGAEAMGGTTNPKTITGGAAALQSAGALALLVGPSIGPVYAHHLGSWGLGIRLVGFSGLVVGEVIASACSSFRDHVCNGSPAPLLVGSAAVFLAGAALEIATTPAAVRAYNHEHAAVIVPTALRASEGVVPGLALAGRF